MMGICMQINEGNIEVIDDRMAKDIQGKDPSAETCHRIWYVVICKEVPNYLKQSIER